MLLALFLDYRFTWPPADTFSKAPGALRSDDDRGTAGNEQHKPRAGPCLVARVT